MVPRTSMVSGHHIGTSLLWITQRWPTNAYGWFMEGLHAGRSNPMGEALLLQLLPPGGMGVLHVCLSLSFLCCACLVWQGREVVHRDTVRRRTAASTLPIVAAVVVQQAQQQGRLHQAGGSPGGLDTVKPSPGASDFASEKFAQAPGSEPCSSAMAEQASPASSLDPTSMDLLAKVFELKYRLSERGSLGGLLADQAGRFAHAASESCATRHRRGQFGCLAQHLELIPMSSSNLGSTSEMRVAQHTQMAQFNLNPGGKDGAAKTLGVTDSDSAREEAGQRLLPAGHTWFQVPNAGSR